MKYLQQKHYGLQSLRYLLSGPLQEKIATSWSRQAHLMEQMVLKMWPTFIFY